MHKLIAIPLFTLLASTCQATVIASVGTGVDAGRSLTSPGSGAYSFGWSQSSAYTGVSINIVLFEQSQITGGAPGTIDVYLTDQVGATTTALANELFSATVPFAAFHSGALTIFSGLNLGPGNYYVTVTGGTGFATIGEVTVPTVVLDSGVALLGNHFTCCSPSAYIPSLVTPWAFSSWAFEVNGTSAVPEPSTLWLAPAAAAILAIRRRRR